jgi:hypothetical protein
MKSATCATSAVGVGRQNNVRRADHITRYDATRGKERPTIGRGRARGVGGTPCRMIAVHALNEN